jgi:hypothetical protein
MLAHYIFKNMPCGDKRLDEKDTSNIAIAMMVIDPVLQSKVQYEGAEGLDHNPNLLKYHAIIMENVNSGLMGGPGGMMYPFKFVQVDNDTACKVYYINMPGKHGSGTQPKTSAIGKVVMELIKSFMMNVGTEFKTDEATPLEMCEYFAQIHIENPKNAKGKRLIFDDSSTAEKHEKGKESYQPTTGRESSLELARAHNVKYLSNEKKMRHYKYLQEFPYFINPKHANYFAKAFPKMWGALSQTSTITPVEYFAERDNKMYKSPALKATWDSMLSLDFAKVAKFRT